MARPKATTVRTFMRLDPDAVELLGRLAPSENKRGAYVSSLIRRAGQEAGLVEEAPPAGKLDLLVLQNQLRSLQARVEAALEHSEG